MIFLKIVLLSLVVLCHLVSLHIGVGQILFIHSSLNINRLDEYLLKRFPDLSLALC